MLTQLFLMVVEAVFGFFSMMLLARFLMQMTRAPFRNPLGRFVIAVTDGLVRPVRRILPNPFNFDLASLLLAWILQAMFLGFAFGLAGAIDSMSTKALGVVSLLAIIETVRLTVYLMVGAVVVAAALSWINPYSPVAPLFDALVQPLLAPFRRRLPTVGGVDVSPLLVLLLLQVVLALVGWARAAVAAQFGPS